MQEVVSINLNLKVVNPKDYIVIHTPTSDGVLSVHVLRGSENILPGQFFDREAFSKAIWAVKKEWWENRAPL